MSLLYRFRYPILALVLLVGAALFPHLRTALEVDNSLTTWFIDDDPALQSYYRFQEHFGNDEVVILGLHHPGGFGGVEPLQRLRDLSDSLQGKTSVVQVLSAGTARMASGSGFSVSTRPLLPAGKIDSAAVARALAQNPFLRKQYFSADMRTARLVLRLAQSPHFEQERGEILHDIYAVVNHFWPAEQSHFGGIGVIYEALNDMSRQDFGRFLGLGYLLMFVLIFAIYRRWAYVGYALGTIALATYFTLAIYGAFGLRLNLMTTLVPAIIILLCVMDVMHILNERSREEPGTNLRQSALQSLRTVWRPCLFTTLTTMAGFLSLLASPVKIVANFGLFAALGILLGLFFSFLLGVMILPHFRHRQGQEKTSQWLVQWQEQLFQKPKKALLAVGLLVVLAIGGSLNLRVDTDSMGYLPKEHPVQQDNRSLEKYFGSYMPLEYLVYPQDSFSMQSPQLLQALQIFSDSVLQLPQMGEVIGYHSFYRSALEERYAEDWRQGWQKRQTIYNIGQRAEQLYPELVRNFTTADYQIGRISFTGAVVSASALKAIMADIERLSRQLVEPYAQLEVSGYQSLYATIVNYVTLSLLRSFAGATLLIFALLLLHLRQWRLALLSLLPNFFPVLAMLGFMGWLGLSLDTATATIASIVLSFSIDDTVHFAGHYRRLRRQGSAAVAARQKTMAHVGRAIVLTSVVLFCGYFLMIFGSLKTVIYFGLLTAFSILAALFSQLVIFPLLLHRFDSD